MEIVQDNLHTVIPMNGRDGEPYHVIWTDENMREMEGTDLLKGPYGGLAKISWTGRDTQGWRDNCRQAGYLAELVEGHPDLELLVPVSLNIVCFRYVVASLTEAKLKDINNEIVMRLQENGIAAPSTTILKGILAIRVNITNHRSKRQDFDLLVNAVVETGKRIISELEAGHESL